MSKNPQFGPANSHWPDGSFRGAPMGRPEFGRGLDLTSAEHARTIRVFRVRLGRDGYDEGGAYWGAEGEFTPRLYCAWNIGREPDGQAFRVFVRAQSRRGAIDALNIPERMLVSGIRRRF